MSDDFLPYPAGPGWKAEGTSREAAENIAERAVTLRALCYHFLREHPYHTADEVAEALGESVLAIRPRVSELHKAELVVADGRGVNVSGASANLWRLKTADDHNKGKQVRQRTELRKYQHRVIEYLYGSDNAFAILKMGAGKTISTLTALGELISDNEIRHALIVAPKRVATIVWPTEITSWEHTRGLRFTVLDGDQKHRKIRLDTADLREITIIGIDNLQWLVEQLKNLPPDHRLFDCLVIDETSKLKDPKSKRAKALGSIADRFKIRWGLTGTPTPNSLLDLHTPVKIIAPDLWPRSFYKWQREHFYPIDRNGYQWQVLPGQDVRIKQDFASIAIALGEDEMPDLPELSVLVDEVVLPDNARILYKDMERKLFARIDEHDILAVSKAVATGKLAQAANGFMYGPGGNTDVVGLHWEKEAWLAELVDNLDGEPAILVYEFREDLTMLRRLFGDDLPYLGAGVSDQQAQQHVDAWNRGELPLFALHPASGGHGLNLQGGGSRMVWIAPTWSAELWDQTIARIHRPGQKSHVMVHVCVATDTVDELKLSRVYGKLSAQQAFERYLSASAASRAA